MKRILIILTVYIVSCKKDEPLTKASLEGNWTFTHETSTTAWNWAPTSDSIYVTFDRSNRYAFYQYNFPVDKGTFSIMQDSVLTIRPDSTYSPFFHLLHNLFYNSGPDTALHYIGERVHFQKNSPNELVLNISWTGLTINGIRQNNVTVQNKFYWKNRP